MLESRPVEIIGVTREQVDSVMSLISDAIRDMEKNSIHQWDDSYPGRGIILADIDGGNLYSAVDDSSLLGIVALNESQSPEYDSLSWKDQGRPLIVHRLCIDPRFQGQGLAKHLMKFAEDFGRKHRYSSIRLDAFVCNQRAVGLYNSLKYVVRGSVRFRKGNFYCFEKIL